MCVHVHGHRKLLPDLTREPAPESSTSTRRANPRLAGRGRDSEARRPGAKQKGRESERAEGGRPYHHSRTAQARADLGSTAAWQGRRRRRQRRRLLRRRGFPPPRWRRDEFGSTDGVRWRGAGGGRGRARVFVPRWFGFLPLWRSGGIVGKGRERS